MENSIHWKSRRSLSWEHRTSNRGELILEMKAELEGARVPKKGIDSARLYSRRIIELDEDLTRK